MVMHNVNSDDDHAEREATKPTSECSGFGLGGHLRLCCPAPSQDCQLACPVQVQVCNQVTVQKLTLSSRTDFQ